MVNNYFIEFFKLFHVIDYDLIAWFQAADDFHRLIVAIAQGDQYFHSLIPMYYKKGELTGFMIVGAIFQ